MREPPPFGSLLELLCLYVQSERAKIAVLGARAQAQAAIGGDAAATAFQEFINAHQRVEVEATKKRMLDQMEELKKIAEIRFAPMVTIGKRTKLPTVSAETIRAQGLLREQMSVSETDYRQPGRARKQRKSR